MVKKQLEDWHKPGDICYKGQWPVIIKRSPTNPTRLLLEFISGEPDKTGLARRPTQPLPAVHVNDEFTRAVNRHGWDHKKSLYQAKKMLKDTNRKWGSETGKNRLPLHCVRHNVKENSEAADRVTGSSDKVDVEEIDEQLEKELDEPQIYEETMDEVDEPTEEYHLDDKGEESEELEQGKIEEPNAGLFGRFRSLFRF
uniref:Uncharacterized protein n=1 Tax=Caenorhabditis japonica TaxID=281687 RepID=A0A8R1DL73_CAEJA